MSELGPLPGILGGFWLVMVIFLIALAILWFLLPFAVFGIKKRLDQNARAMRAILDRLASIDASLKGQPSPDRAADADGPGPAEKFLRGGGDPEHGAHREPALRARR